MSAQTTESLDGAERREERNKLLVGLSAILLLGLLLFLIAEVLKTHLPNWPSIPEVLKGFALAVAPAAIVVLYDHFWTIKQVASEVSRNMQSSMIAIMEQSIAGSTRYGLVAFHNRLDFETIFKNLQDGDELLWLDTYCPRHKEFLNELSSALERGASLRMLVIDPECRNVQCRASEIKRAYDAEEFKQEVATFRRQILKTIADGKHRGHCNLLLYDDLPCIPMYIILRKGELHSGYSSFYFTEPSAFFVHLEWIPREHGILPTMQHYFEQKWAYAATCAQNRAQENAVL